ncbi:MAG: DUF488 domain-containing protein [Candidatus Aminicenantes bacterium]|nr:DUF488 domain-containing protein [Candidatus Aminicenantes bacterium]
MLKRQILLLALLEELGELSNTEMMKYLFLLTRYQDKKSYHFVPYKYGCFSFNAYADKRKLIERGILKDSDEWVLSEDQKGFYFMLPRENRSLITKIKKGFAHLQKQELIRYTYLKYPYYAVNSEILNEVLSAPEISQIKACMPQNDMRAIYTIGYESRSIEEYINCLIKNDVKILCDVRKNPISRKYGFSKKTMSRALETVGIEYRHIPGLGIVGEKRKDLHDLEDYNRLFDLYEKEVLSSSSNLLKIIYELLLENNRVGLTCFEKLPAYCHRTRAAEAVVRLFDRDLPIIEL